MKSFMNKFPRLLLGQKFILSFSKEAYKSRVMQTSIRPWGEKEVVE